MTYEIRKNFVGLNRMRFRLFFFLFLLLLQLMQKFSHGLFTSFRRAGEIDLSPSPHVVRENWIQQRVEFGPRLGIGTVRSLPCARQTCLL